MNYNNQTNNNQSNFLIIPNFLKNFKNTNTINDQNNNLIIFEGHLEITKEDRVCPICGGHMCINKTYNTILKHIPIGSTKSLIKIERIQFICSCCNTTKSQEIPFQNDNHLITTELFNYITDLLKKGNFNNTEVAFLSGVNRNIIKDIDKKRLLEKYTINNKELIKPIKYSKYLAIDEFKLHNGYIYATHIIDLETGNVLWIAKGKKKQVVYDFINHVGLDWMKKVIAVACDMNSDFEKAFKEKCPNINIVYDYFHIVKNLNEKVITPIRIEEQNRLEKSGDKEAARKLKRTKYILMSSKETLKKKDIDVTSGKVISKESKIFKKDKVIRKGIYYEKYEELINNNLTFFTLDMIKELLSEAYNSNSETEMVELIFDIMELCEADGNKNLLWFRDLLYNHFDGIISHANFKISTGKIEGINNKIKTLRRQAYGYPDDEYFFLKIIDITNIN